MERGPGEANRRQVRPGQVSRAEEDTSSRGHLAARGSEGGTGAGGAGPGQASLECPHEVELLAVLAGEDGGLFVVLHQLVHGVEPPLPDAVDAVHELHLEMFVLP